MKKDKMLQIRITDSEYDELKMMANMQGITVSELVRSAVMFDKLTLIEEQRRKKKRINDMFHEINKEVSSWL